MGHARPIGGPSAASDALCLLRAELLEVAHERKVAVLALERQRLLFFQNACEAQLLVACPEREELFWQIWWKKKLPLHQAKLFTRAVPQRLILEAERVSHAKGAVSQLLRCSPHLQLYLERGKGAPGGVHGRGRECHCFSSQCWGGAAVLPCPLRC
ncbi:uncharacterized protein Tco025E_05920 [Trypanosoma conorhini]|uniref:Uncharacterized protein n=1 Tax=Trypanosoma conorhini TaxID=83891 RepID=A0A422P9J2_9TRYP|nr:uncharacterized protein Tco025E_05920 [Trypanosoma conorhini]RNF14362.1 hypothetical protein Tco025E_05920 [Trypanosoma conorhini]